MKSRFYMRFLSVCVLVGSLVSSKTATFPIKTELVANGFSLPVFAGAPPGDSSRLFILEQHTGKIRIIDLASGNVGSVPFLQISGLPQGSEQGLLGLAFHPDYAVNGLFYINATV